MIIVIAQEDGDTEDRFKRMVIDIATRDIYMAEIGEFIRPKEFHTLLEGYNSRDLDQELEKKIEESYKSHFQRGRIQK